MGVLLFRPGDERVTQVRSKEDAKAFFHDHMPMVRSPSELLPVFAASESLPVGTIRDSPVIICQGCFSSESSPVFEENQYPPSLWSRRSVCVSVCVCVFMCVCVHTTLPQHFMKDIRRHARLLSESWFTKGWGGSGVVVVTSGSLLIAALHLTGDHDGHVPISTDSDSMIGYHTATHMPMQAASGGRSRC